MRSLSTLFLVGVASLASVQPATAAPSPELIGKVNAVVDAAPTKHATHPDLPQYWTET